MRYDLEINIVGELTLAGLYKATDALYTENKIITPAQWDTRTLTETTLVNKGSVDTSKYRNGKNISPAAYSSGTYSDNDISLYKYLIRDNIICPLFTGGSVYIHNYKYDWSNNTVVREMDIDLVDGFYYCNVEPDIDPTTIDIHTLTLKYPGYVSYGRRWTNVPYIEDSTLKTMFSASKDNNKYVLVPVKSGDTLLSYMIILNNHIIEYRSIDQGVLAPEESKIFSLREFPLENLTVKAIKLDETEVTGFSDFKNFTSVLRVENKTVDSFHAVCSWRVKPIISYKQTSRSSNLDVVYKNINVIPNSLSFRDGAMCLFNLYGSPGGTILTDDGTNILYPFHLTVEANKTSLGIYDTARLTAKVTSANNIPVKGAKITFQLDSDTTKFVESNDVTCTAKTGIDGLAQASLIVKQNKFGWYAQKEWINGDTITLPFDIGQEDPNEIYLYFVTSDDPVLGKAFADYGDGGDPKGQFSFMDVLNRAETPIEEVYNRPKDFGSYEINGRKIAYVKLQRSQGSSTLFSSFVKPESVQTGQQATLRYKNLFIRNTLEPIISAKNFPTTAVKTLTAPVATPITTTGHRSGSLPQIPGLSQESLTVYEMTSDNCTVIKFAEALPLNDSVAGVWLITGSGGYLRATAYFSDEANGIHLECKEPVNIPVLNFIKSEYEFILSDVALSGQNTAFGAFSYFTVSEHLKNPFGLNACSYACIFSDAIGKRCTNKKIPGQKYYLTDGQGISCIHTPDYDATLQEWNSSLAPEPTPAYKCPGLEARFVNPFILFQGNQ